MLVLVTYGAHSDPSASILECAGQRFVHDLEFRSAVLLWKAPVLASAGDRRLVVEVHLGGEIDALAAQESGGHEAPDSM